MSAPDAVNIEVFFYKQIPDQSNSEYQVPEVTKSNLQGRTIQIAEQKESCIIKIMDGLMKSAAGAAIGGGLVVVATAAFKTVVVESIQNNPSVKVMLWASLFLGMAVGGCISLKCSRKVQELA